MASDSQDTSRVHLILVPTILTTIIAFILTGLRVYVRKHIIKQLDWSDLHNVLSMMLMLIVMGLTLGAVNCGVGRHFKYVDKPRAARGIMYLRVSEFMLILSTVFVKISITLLMKKIFLRTKPWKIFLWSFIFFNTLYSFIDAALIFPQCTPVEYNWNKAIKGNCWSNAVINGVGIAQGSIAAITDFTLALLPLVFLWNIKITWRVKMGIWAIMSLGFASGAFAIMRTILVPSLTTSTDPTWDLVPLFMWAIFEANFGVIAAAMPSVRPLLGGAKPRSTGYSAQGTPSSQLRSEGCRTGKSRYLLENGPQLSRSRHAADSDEIDSESGESQINLWPLKSDGITKITELDVVHSSAIEPIEQKPPPSW